MNLPPNDSPLWPILRMAIRTGVVAACLAFVYKQVDSRDIITLAVFVLSDGAMTALANRPSKE